MTHSPAASEATKQHWLNLVLRFLSTCPSVELIFIGVKNRKKEMQSIVAYIVSTESHFGIRDPSKRNFFIFLLEQTNCGLKLDSASESPRVADYVTKALDPHNYTCA